MAWLYLTEVNTGPIYVNMDQVWTMHRTNNQTVLKPAQSDARAVYVKEEPIEIMNKLRDALQMRGGVEEWTDTLP